MTPEEFKACAITILGTNIGWQSKIATILNREPRTIRRWVAGQTPIPPDAAQYLSDLAARKDVRNWPRGKWLTGYDESGRCMICHMQFPRFTARIVSCSDGYPDDCEQPADVISGITYGPSEDAVLCEFEWIDIPPPGDIANLMRSGWEAYQRAAARKMIRKSSVRETSKSTRMR